MRRIQIAGYARITKRQARKRYATGKTFYMCPVNLRPGKPWNPERRIDALDMAEPYPFDSIVENFEYFNCTNTETGFYPAYYVKVEEEAE